MGRYIDVEELTRNIMFQSVTQERIDPVVAGYIIAIIQRAPRVDVREVVHGEWHKNERTFWTCDHCGWINTCDRKLYPFCPNCGADMRVSNEKG